MEAGISIARNIARMRKENALTQEDLATFLGVTKASVSKWETGQSYPDIELLPRIATFFGISIDELVGYEPQLSKQEIRAAYEPMSNKVDEFEHCVYKFVEGLLKIAGKDVKFSFTRSQNINVQETVQTIMMAADHLSDDYVTRKVLTTFGDGDLADDMLRERDAEDMQKINLPSRDEEWTEDTSSQTNE